MDQPRRYLALLLALAILTGCLYRGPKARPFDSPVDRRLIEGVPFYPDDSYLCGPASLAAVLTFQGRPTTVAEASTPLIRVNLRGSLAPDLAIWARDLGYKARFWAAKPEEIVLLIQKNKPVILQIDSGLALKTGHFVVALGYGPEGLVVNSATVQQLIIPWAEFLTRWLKFQNLALLVESPTEPIATTPEPLAPPAPVLTLDKPVT
ncbi:MAG: C39 family peptidase [Deltaproteobacteria bacterium]|jgi:hypothetical protein|nr:C39 family peptidase [Deltaproteobacteria bacterium]